MGFFDKAGRMSRLASKFDECKRNHPGAWAAGIEAADECFAGRTPYLLQNIQTEEDVDRYIRLASEQMVTGVAQGEFDFPEPVTQSSLAAFGISFGKRLRDAFDNERSYQPSSMAPQEFSATFPASLVTEEERMPKFQGQEVDILADPFPHKRYACNRCDQPFTAKVARTRGGFSQKYVLLACPSCGEGRSISKQQAADLIEAADFDPLQ